MAQLNTLLDELEQTGLIRIAQIAPELEYLFRHALVQDAAYGTLLKQDKKALHRAVAQAIETTYPDRVEELAAVLAMHFALAEDDARALHYYIRAGDEAIARYAIAEAIRLYDRAIAIEKRSPDGNFGHPFLQRGRACELIGDYPGALATYTTLEELARARGDGSARLAALIAQATIRATTTTVHDAPEAERLLGEALALARQLGDSAAEARIEWNLMLYYKFTGHGQEAVRHGEISLKIAREHNLREQMAFTMNDLVTHGYLDAGDILQARQMAEEVPKLWAELGNKPMLADSYSSAAIVYFLLGEYDQALRIAGEARTVSEAIGNRWGQSYSRWIVGDIYRDYGELGQAVETMEQSIELGEACGFVGAAAGVGSDLAFLLGMLGRLDEARVRAERAVEASEKHLPNWLPWPLAALGWVQLHSGDLPAAIQTAARIDQVMEHSVASEFASSLFPTRMALAEIALANRDIAGAHRSLDVLDNYAERTGMRAYVPDFHLQRGRTYLAQNEVEAARQSFEKSSAMAEALPSRWIGWQALAALADLARRDHQTAAAEDYRQRALAIIQDIAQRAGRPDLRESFLALAEVRAVARRR